jgi:hypothetical protein
LIYRATNPQNTITEYIDPDMFVCNGSINETSRLQSNFTNDYNRFMLESDINNPLQLNALVEILEDDLELIWSGFVYSKTLQEDEDGQHLEVLCLDPSDRLSSTLIYNDGYIFSETSPAIIILDESLEYVEQHGDAAFWYYPNKDSDSWLPIVSPDETNNTVIEAADSSATQLVATIDQAGMLPRGLLYIDTATPEIVSYDGYYDIGSGSKYVFDNVKRGQLGTVAQTIPGSTKVSQFQSQLIHPQTGLVVEGYRIHTSSWQAIPLGLYSVQSSEGAITFSFDPLSLLDDETDTQKYNAFRISMAVFDELSPDTIDLETTITNAIRSVQTKGGMGGMFPVNVDIGDIKLTRTYIKEPTVVRQYIDKILTDCTLITGKVDDPVGQWWDGKTSTYNIQSLIQKTTPDIIYNNAISKSQDISLQDIYSGCLVQYNLGLDYNLCAPTRFYHPIVGDSIGGTTCNYMWKFSLEKNKWTRTDATTSNEWGWSEIFDRNSTTGMGVGLNGNNSSAANLFWFWFDDDANNYTLDSIEAVLDFGERVTNDFSVEIFGVETFNIADPPSSTGLIPLNASLKIEYQLSGTGVEDSTAQGSVTLTAKDIAVNCQGIVIQFTGTPANAHTSWHWGLLKEIRATGTQNKCVFVKITDTPLDATYVYAPNSYDKLVASIPLNDQHRSQIEKIGTATYNMAVALGRLIVEDSLVLTQIKSYTINSDIVTIPSIGQTIHIDDDNFTGICLMYNYQKESNEISLNIDLLDINSPLV